MTIITRDALRDGEKGELRKQFSATVKDVDRENRKASFIISTGGMDRDGDTIASDGWMLDNYRKNPVVLFGHDSRSLPVAKATRVDVNMDLESDAVFADRETYEFADTVFRMLEQRFLNAVSVGFDPVEFKFREADGGIDFLRQELLEYSIVPIPANPNALQRAKEFGIDLNPMFKWAEQVLGYSDDRLVLREAGVPRELLEKVRKETDPVKRTQLLVKGVKVQDESNDPFALVEDAALKFTDAVEKATDRITAAAQEFEAASGVEPEGSDKSKEGGCGCGASHGKDGDGDGEGATGGDPELDEEEFVKSVLQDMKNRSPETETPDGE